MNFPSELVPEGDGCLRPVKGREPDGYHRVLFEGERWSAHRLSYHLNVSPIPRQVQDRKIGLVLHECDNRGCVNPKHLYLGTQAQNMRDRFDRFEGLREKLSQAHKGLKQSEKTKKKRADALRGSKRTPEQCANISRALKGKKRKPHPAAVKEKISASVRSTLAEKKKWTVSS